MEKIYADVIIKGKRTLDSVPEKLRERVRGILLERGYPELAEEEMETPAGP